MTPQKLREVEYVDIHKVLQEHFKPKTIKITKKLTFYEQNQQLSKTVLIYLAELRRLASTYEFGKTLN